MFLLVKGIGPEFLAGVGERQKAGWFLHGTGGTIALEAPLGLICILRLEHSLSIVLLKEANCRRDVNKKARVATARRFPYLLSLAHRPIRRGRPPFPWCRTDVGGAAIKAREDKWFKFRRTSNEISWRQLFQTLHLATQVAVVDELVAHMTKPSKTPILAPKGHLFVEHRQQAKQAASDSGAARSLTEAWRLVDQI